MTTLRKYCYVMEKGGGSESTIIIGPSKSVLVYALHSLEYVLGLARFLVFVPNYIYIYMHGRRNLLACLALCRTVSSEALQLLAGDMSNYGVQSENRSCPKSGEENS